MNKACNSCNCKVIGEFETLDLGEYKYYNTRNFMRNMGMYIILI